MSVHVQGLDFIDPAEWGMRLQTEVSGLKVLARSSQTLVLEVSGSGDRVWIVKCSTNAAALAREVEVQSSVSHLAVATPRLAGFDLAQRAPWIAYVGEGLAPIPQSERVQLLAIQYLAELHRQGRLMEAPNCSVSHTPALHQICIQLRALPLEALKVTSMRLFGSTTVMRLFVDILRQADAWATVLRARPHVFCHGDAHLGNFMRRRHDHQLQLIDWEFAHRDYVFFDLFQLLDATNPTPPLQRVCSRRRALKRYFAHASEEIVGVSRVGFERDYLRFCMLYLLWVLGRVEADRESDKFPASLLDRQFRETVQGIRSCWSTFSG